MLTAAVVLSLAPTATHPQEAWKPDTALLRKEGGAGTEKNVRRAIDWLLRHQEADGRWGCASFVERCADHGGEACGDPGNPTHDIGVTALAVLVLTGTGSTYSAGGFTEPIGRAVDWLVAQQTDEGLVGSDNSHDFVYDQVLATYALCEAVRGVDDDALREAAQAAIRYLERARNPGGAWRYDVPPIGDNDTSITVWVLGALVAGARAELEVSVEALEGGLDWIDEMTLGGRIGYDSAGSLSSRTTAHREYPREISEAMTAGGIWVQFLVGRDPAEPEPLIETVAKTPPEWAEDELGNDMYYWLHGTNAMFQVGGKPWKAWNTALKSALTGSQRKGGGADGSWDPIGPWGYSGGRVYATAFNALSLEVYYRYPRFNESVDLDAHYELMTTMNAAPRIVTASAEIVGEREVRLASFDWTLRGGKRLELRYSLDGSDPLRGNPVYRKPFVLKKPVELVVQAFMDGEPVGEMAELAFTKVKPRPASKLRKPKPGLQVKMFHGSWDGIPDVRSFEPDATEITHQAMSPSRVNRPMAVHLTGFLKIPEDEMYRFRTRAHDGIRVTVAEEEIVYVDGLHTAPRRAYGKVPLAKGWHPILIEWFTSDGKGTFRVEMAPVGEHPVVITQYQFGHR